MTVPENPLSDTFSLSPTTTMYLVSLPADDLAAFLKKLRRSRHKLPTAIADPLILLLASPKEEVANTAQEILIKMVDHWWTSPYFYSLLNRFSLGDQTLTPQELTMISMAFDGKRIKPGTRIFKPSLLRVQLRPDGGYDLSVGGKFWQSIDGSDCSLAKLLTVFLDAQKQGTYCMLKDETLSQDTPLIDRVLISRVALGPQHFGEETAFKSNIREIKTTLDITCNPTNLSSPPIPQRKLPKVKDSRIFR